MNIVQHSSCYTLCFSRSSMHPRAARHIPSTPAPSGQRPGTRARSKNIPRTQTLQCKGRNSWRGDSVTEIQVCNSARIEGWKTPWLFINHPSALSHRPGSHLHCSEAHLGLDEPSRSQVPGCQIQHRRFLIVSKRTSIYRKHQEQLHHAWSALSSDIQQTAQASWT